MTRTLIVDDEKRAINILRILIEKHLPAITQIETAQGAKEGLRIFGDSQFDLIFLDIEMPGMTGFELLAAMKETRPEIHVIFTTAYDHYAIKAIRFSAIDYLLKPIDVEELKAAYQRFEQVRNRKSEVTIDLMNNLILNLRNANVKKPRLAVATQGGAVFFDIEEIVRCEADNNYTIFYLDSGKKFVASKTLKEYDNMLQEYDFIRVHQSHLINPAYIKQYTTKGMIEMRDSTRVPVSRRKHHWVVEKLGEIYKAG